MCLHASTVWQYRLLGLLLMLVAAAVGCEQERVTVRPEPGGNSYGRKELIDAVEGFASGERSPERFRDLATAIDALRPRFDASMAEEAERHLVMMALGPLRAGFDEPLDVQLEALATTVWPTALEVMPAPGEKPAAYAERICREALVLQCKQVVPEARALVLSALVWARLSERAREIVYACKECRDSEGFGQAVRDYERFARDMDKRRYDAEALSSPDRWPHAGDKAAPWSDMPLVVVPPGGEATLDGQLIAPGQWQADLDRARKRSDVLGIHMVPAARVRDLRAILRDAAGAGFAQVALQARAPAYPYLLVEYRIITGGRKRDSRLVRVRDVDTIQVLMQALDALAEEDGLPPRI
jgi:hypothetical protein